MKPTCAFHQATPPTPPDKSKRKIKEKLLQVREQTNARESQLETCGGLNFDTNYTWSGEWTFTGLREEVFRWANTDLYHLFVRIAAPSWQFETRSGSERGFIFLVFLEFLIQMSSSGNRCCECGFVLMCGVHLMRRLGASCGISCVTAAAVWMVTDSWGALLLLLLLFSFLTLLVLLHAQVSACLTHTFTTVSAAFPNCCVCWSQRKSSEPFTQFGCIWTRLAFAIQVKIIELISY